MVNFVRVCPHCRSRRLEAAGATALRTGGDVVDYQCLACGRVFPPFFAIEVDESLAK